MTTDDPFVSVITVVFNSKSLIEKTINSVLGQSSDNYEYIIIDGASTDGTIDIIKKYKRIDHFISEPDKGIYDAMNKGLQIAKGKYVWFINSGDQIESIHTLQNIISQNQDADIFFGETNLINERGDLLGTRSNLSTRKLPQILTWKKMMFGMVVSHQSIIVKKSIAPYYFTQYRCSADIDWVIASLKAADKIVNTQLVLSRYLVGGFSIKNARRCLNERFKVLKKHFGIGRAVFAHVVILGRGGYYKMVGKANY